MTSHPRTISLSPNDRLFEPFRHLLTLTASIGIAANAVGTGRYMPVQESVFPSREFNVALYLPTLGPVEMALRDQKPNKIEIFIKPSPQLPQQSSGSSKSLFPLFGFVASVVFVNFYEANLSWLQTKFTKDTTNWPPLFDFCRVIRNFASHNGRVYFQNPNAAKQTWHHISYSPADQGRQVIGTEFQYAEIVLLMIEMSDELDKLAAPIA